MGDDMMETLRSVLGNGADEKINSVLDMLKPAKEKDGGKDIKISDNKQDILKSLPADGKNAQDTLMYLAKIKGIVDEMGHANDPRSRLLLSLRPYMRESRQKSIDNAVKLLNLSRIGLAFLGR